MLHEQTINDVLQVVLETGIILKENCGNISSHSKKSSSAADVVTEFDQQIEQQLLNKLQKITPDIGFFGEEFGKQDKKNRFWLVDPIDGTAHFIRGNPICTTMITLIEDEEPTLSIINNFNTNELFMAQKGKGATMNGMKIQVSSRPLIDGYLFHEINLYINNNLDTYLALRKKCILTNTLTSGYEHTQVAIGKMDGRITIDPFGKDWDYAPGALLIKEAGGIVQNIGSRDYDYRNHNYIAVNPVIYNELVTEFPVLVI